MQAGRVHSGWKHCFVIVTSDFMPLRYALAAKGIVTLARTHSRDADDVAKGCDFFDGVVIPYAEDVELIKRHAAVYRPLNGEALERASRKANGRATRPAITSLKNAPARSSCQ